MTIAVKAGSVGVLRQPAVKWWCERSEMGLTADLWGAYHAWDVPVLRAGDFKVLMPILIAPRFSNRKSVDSR